MQKKTIILLLSAFLLHLTACSTLKPNTQINAQLLETHQSTYQKIAYSSWPKLSSKKIILPSHRSPLIPKIRERLIALNDLNTYHFKQDILYDNTLKIGIKRFQKRHGLEADAIIGQSTLNNLNISPNIRLKQIKQAQLKWESLAQNNSIQEYIHINTASYLLNIYQGQENKLQMNVVIGSPAWPTPLLTSQIETVVINPKWNIPKNITEKEIIHKIADNVNYLQEENIKIIDGWHKGAKQIEPSSIDWQNYIGDEDLPFRLVQDFGKDNALGQVKFTFPNSEYVYLHDTPHKAAFKLSKRNLSHGCIRLESPIALLNYLIDNNRLGHKEKINQHIKDRAQTKHYALKKPIPIYITQINAWVDNKGLINFRDEPAPI